MSQNLACASNLFIFLTAFLLSACSSNQAPPDMVLIPSGYFSMGTDEKDSTGHALSLGLDKPWYSDEGPERRFSLPDYSIDRYEVTNRQYYIFSQATDHLPPLHWKSPKYSGDIDNHPVTNINYYDANAYCEWAGKRLPSEAEWEKAARGEKANLYPWGQRFDPSYANLSLSNRTRATSGLKTVGSYPKGVSPFGVHDMIGNAWEWVWEYYKPYPGNKDQDYKSSRKQVVVRGLSYMGLGHFPKKEYRKVLAIKARVSFREKLSPLSRRIDLGFRCARDEPGFFESLFKPEIEENTQEIT